MLCYYTRELAPISHSVADVQYSLHSSHGLEKAGIQR